VAVGLKSVAFASLSEVRYSVWAAERRANQQLTRGIHLAGGAELGACYNTILVPTVNQDIALAAVGEALERLGCRMVHREEPAPSQGGFHYRSVRMILVGLPGRSGWLPLSSWGDGLSCPFPDWYRKNPLAMALSLSLSPVFYLFSFDAGWVAGYSVFEGGQQVEAQSLTSRPDRSLKEFTPPLKPPQLPSRLGRALDEPQFEFETFARGFQRLEVAVAALASRLGVPVHLIDPLDVQDGDGAIVLEDGKYRRVSPSGWVGLYYEKGSG
jgi:hypothetical protein